MAPPAVPSSARKAIVRRTCAWSALVVGHSLQIVGVFFFVRTLETQIQAWFFAAFVSIGIALVLLLPVWFNLLLFGANRSWIGFQTLREIPPTTRALEAHSGTICIPGSFSTNAPVVAWRVGPDGFAASIPVIGEFFIPWGEVEFVNAHADKWFTEVVHKGNEVNSPIYCPSRVGQLIATSHMNWMCIERNG